MYVLRDREAGITEFDEFDTYEEAQKALEKYEEEDKKSGDYTPNFYEVVEK